MTTRHKDCAYSCHLLKTGNTKTNNYRRIICQNYVSRIKT